MRFLLLLALVGSACVSSVRADEPITPGEAVKKVGEVVTVKLTVKSSRTMNDLCFLNSAADFRDAENLTLFIGGAAREKF